MGWSKASRWTVSLNSGQGPDAESPYTWYARYDDWPTGAGSGEEPIPALRIVAHELSHALGLDFDSSPCDRASDSVHHITSGAGCVPPMFPATSLSDLDRERIRDLYDLNPKPEIAAGRGTATIDGALAGGEWAGAGRFQFTFTLPEPGCWWPCTPTQTTTATLFVMNDSVNLYLALKIDGTGPIDTVSGPLASGYWSLVLDEDTDGLSAGDDYLAFYTPNYFHDWVCTEPYYYVADTSRGGSVDGAAKSGFDGTNTVFELRHPLASGDGNDISVLPGQTVRLIHLGTSVSLPDGAYAGANPVNPNDPQHRPALVIVLAR